MGCDGGTIPRRDELVRTKKRRPRSDRRALKAAKWNNCAISQLPLRKPIASCRLGKLYNKDELIRAMIERKDPKSSELYRQIHHIRKLRKDTRDLRLTTNPDFNESGAINVVDSESRARFICPITGLEMNGLHRFVFVWNCGCVLSKRAFGGVKGDRCLVCDREIDELVVINPENEDCKSEPKPEPVGNDSRKRKDSDFQSVVQNDPGKSDVYKSLFTTSHAAKRQKSAHWVTYNPQYF